MTVSLFLSSCCDRGITSAVGALCQRDKNENPLGRLPEGVAFRWKIQLLARRRLRQRHTRACARTRCCGRARECGLRRHEPHDAAGTYAFFQRFATAIAAIAAMTSAVSCPLVGSESRFRKLSIAVRAIA